MNGDILGTLLIISIVGVILIISELLAHKDILSKETARKLIHISVGNIIFIVPLFENRLLVTAIPLFFVFGNYLLSPISPIKKFKFKTFEAGHTWGTILYPLSLAIVIFMGFDDLWITLASFFTVVYGDGFAAITGPKAITGQFKMYSGQKTLIGTLTVSFASWMSVLIGITILGYSIQLAIITSAIVAVVAPIVELLSIKGTDNLLMPPIIFTVIYLLKNEILSSTNFIDFNMFILSVILGGLVAVLGYKAKALTVDGAIAGFLLAVIMLGLSGWVFGSQLFLFFFIGTLATKLAGRKNKDKQDEFEKGSERRDSLQALAKAGLSAVLAIVYTLTQYQVIIYFFSATLTSAIVDTLSTEIGISFKGTPRMVLKPWRIVEKGESGAISLIGSFGGFLSGIIFTSIVYAVSIIDTRIEIANPLFIILVAVSGVIGMLFDSILGAHMQKMNICVECGKILEASVHHDKETIYHRGIKFMRNDLVNFLGTLIGGIAGYGLYYLFIN